MRLSSLTIVTVKDYGTGEKIASGNAEFSNDKGITIKIVLEREDIEDMEHMLRGKLKNLAGEM